MKLCGIDSSTQRTGMSLFSDEKLTDYLLIDFHNEKDKEIRIDKMMITIGEQLNKWQPDVLYIEDTWDRNNIETLKMLTYIVGGVRYWCSIHDCEFIKIIPSKWRSIIGIQKNKTTRSEYKRLAIEMVRDKYDVDVNDDVADAILIGCAGVSEQLVDDLFI